MNYTQVTKGAIGSYIVALAAYNRCIPVLQSLGNFTWVLQASFLSGFVEGFEKLNPINAQTLDIAENRMRTDKKFIDDVKKAYKFQKERFDNAAQNLKNGNIPTADTFLKLPDTEAAAPDRIIRTAAYKVKSDKVDAALSWVDWTGNSITAGVAGILIIAEDLGHYCGRKAAHTLADMLSINELPTQLSEAVITTTTHLACIGLYIIESTRELYSTVIELFSDLGSAAAAGILDGFLTNKYDIDRAVTKAWKAVSSKDINLLLSSLIKDAKLAYQSSLVRDEKPEYKSTLFRDAKLAYQSSIEKLSKYDDSLKKEGLKGAILMDPKRAKTPKYQDLFYRKKILEVSEGVRSVTGFNPHLGYWSNAPKAILQTGKSMMAKTLYNASMGTVYLMRYGFSMGKKYLFAEETIPPHNVSYRDSKKYPPHASNPHSSPTRRDASFVTNLAKNRETKNQQARKG